MSDPFSTIERMSETVEADGEVGGEVEDISAGDLHALADLVPTQELAR